MPEPRIEPLNYSLGLAENRIDPPIYTAPPRYEDAVVCFCGHGLFDHDDYGPCAKCAEGLCRGFNGCLVIGRGRRAE